MKKKLTNTRTRCKYSYKWIEDAARNSPYTKTNRYGYVVGETRDQQCYKVLWDGVGSTTTFHKSFIELLPDDPDQKLWDELKASEIL